MIEMTIAPIEQIEMKVVSGGHTYPTYQGPYTFTPSAEEQTIEISRMVARQDITIGAIPSNYGRITWDGSTLTVS